VSLTAGMVYRLCVFVQRRERTGPRGKGCEPVAGVGLGEPAASSLPLTALVLWVLETEGELWPPNLKLWTGR
jgi:hypothetical protein